MRKRLSVASLAAVVVLGAGVGRAEVFDHQPSGFEVGHVTEIAAPSARVWKALGQIGAWWNPKHTFSGDSRNLTLELKPGGCWCETLEGGGGVRHMTVVAVRPGQSIVLEGALGPLQATGAMGHMTWTLHDMGARTTITVRYDVGGYVSGGLEKLATPVDSVLAEQAERLKLYVETGKPE